MHDVSRPDPVYAGAGLDDPSHPVHPEDDGAGVETATLEVT